MSLNKDGASQDFQTNVVTVFSPTTIAGQTSYAGSLLFDGNDLSSAGPFPAPEQYAKLQNMFNMYQEYKLSGIRFQWHPRHENSAGVGPVYNGGSGVYSYPDYGATQTGAPSSVFTDLWHFYFKFDRNDSTTRLNSLEELLQTMIQPDVMHVTSSSSGDFYYNPSLMDAKLQTYSAATINTISGPSSNLQGGAIGLQGSSPFTVVPDNVKGSWQPTKIPQVNSQSVAGATIKLNMDMEWYSMKWYAFNPFIQGNAGTGAGYVVPCGWLQLTYFWSFRLLETRASVILLTMNDGLAKDAIIRNLCDQEPKLQVLEDTTFNRHRSDYPSHPVFINADELSSKQEEPTNSSEKRRKLMVSSKPS